MADALVAEVVAGAKDGELFVDHAGTQYRVSLTPNGPELSVWHADLDKRRGWISCWTAKLVVIPGLRSLHVLERPKLKARR